MSFARVYGAQTALLSAQIVSVETDISKGLHAFSIVGLPDKAVEESRDRVAAAIKNAGFTSPKSQNQKITTSLAPASAKKEGAVFDVAIALSYLLASGTLVFNPKKKLFVGELSLDGGIRPVYGVLPLVAEAKRKGFVEVYVPKENAQEGALLGGIAIYGVETLMELIAHLDEKQQTEGKPYSVLKPQKKTRVQYPKTAAVIEFDDIRGQETAKRALTIAAAGKHNVALYGPPGTGKTMLARAFTTLLPPLSFKEMLESTSIYSVTGMLDEQVVTATPFRSPHHTASYVSMVGGGANLRPGEITLAHNGVLFLDEFPEFERRVIEALREPLEEGAVSISRASGSARFPAHFILIAAFNPCPCGAWGTQKTCVCSPAALERYRKKLSGPIIDRIDMWVEVGNIDHDILTSAQKAKTKSDVRGRVAQARKTQASRFKKLKRHIATNSEMNVKDLEACIDLREGVRDLLKTAVVRMNLSPRSYHRTIKLAQTIADLERTETIEEAHMLEALQYRPQKFLN
jgi:magnesium chelatase family protein